jgi:hypothetical protein
MTKHVLVGEILDKTCAILKGDSEQTRDDVEKEMATARRLVAIQMIMLLHPITAPGQQPVDNFRDGSREVKEFPLDKTALILTKACHDFAGFFVHFRLMRLVKFLQHVLGKGIDLVRRQAFAACLQDRVGSIVGDFASLDSCSLARILHGSLLC